MLVLSRKKGERIQIGDDIHVSITQIKGNRVTIGIEAPPEVSIRRCELAVANQLEPSEQQRAVVLNCQQEPRVA